jgi:hypothetical protein
MTLAQIMELALRQLDEDPADIAEYDMKFRVYANEGYRLAAHTYLKPKERITLRTNSEGRAHIDGMRVVRIVDVYDSNGHSVQFSMDPEGDVVLTFRRNAELTAVCEIELPMLEAAAEEPRLPDYVHHALSDYICYRHLSSGNAAKQNRAQFFLAAFHQTMRGMRPQGGGSVTRMKNLYTASDIRNSR